MFRDFKEYQEIAKLYTEKVSKTKDLDENRNTRGSELAAKRLADKPKTRVEVGLKPRNLPAGQTSVRQSGVNDPRRNKTVTKPIPSTDQIRKDNPKVVPGTRVNEIGAKGGGKPSSGDLSAFKDKKPEAKPKPKLVKFKGKMVRSDNQKYLQRQDQLARTKAMFDKRKAEGKTIQQVKDENKASMRAKAAERNAAFKAKRAEKRAEKKAGNVKPAPEEKSSENKVTQTKSTEVAVNKTQVPVNKKEVPVNKKTSSNSSALNVSSTKKNTQKNNSKFENNPRVKNFRKDVKDLKTTAKYGSTATIQTLDGKEYKPGDPGYEAELKKARSMVQKSMKREEFTPYDIVLEYLLSTEQVATIEEANYVMTEMDAETIQGIVEEQKKNIEEGLPLLAKGAMVVGGAVLAKKGLDKAKKSFDNYINKQRDKGIGGNTRPGSDKIYYGK